MSHRRILAAVCTAFVLLGGASLAATGSAHGLSPAEYVAHGMPDPTHPWRARDYEAAARVLKQLADAQLPQTGDRVSGSVIDHIVDRRALKFLTDRSIPMEARFPDSTALLQAEIVILQRYADAEARDITFGTDSMRIAGFLLYTADSVLTLIDEFLPTIDKNDPTYPTRMAGLEKVRLGLSQMILGSLDALDQGPRYTDASRTKFAATVAELFPSFSRMLPAATIQQVRARLHRLATTDRSPNVRAALAVYAK